MWTSKNRRLAGRAELCLRRITRWLRWIPPALTSLLVMLPNSGVAGTSYPAVVIPDYKVGLAPINGLSGLASPEAACNAWRASWVVGDIAERSWQSAIANVGDEYAGQAVTWICTMQSTPQHLYHPLESHAPVYATYACGPNSSSNASLPWKCDCAPGFESVANSACVREASKNISRDVPTEDMCFARGNPVVPGTGEKIQNEPDLEFGFDNGLRFERQYRSRRIGNTDPALGGLPDPAAVVAGMDLVWSHNWRHQLAQCIKYLLELRTGVAAESVVLLRQRFGGVLQFGQPPGQVAMRGGQCPHAGPALSLFTHMSFLCLLNNARCSFLGSSLRLYGPISEFSGWSDS
jgi:hypothetical protein